MAGGMAIGQTNLVSDLQSRSLTSSDRYFSLSQKVGYAFLLHIYSSPVTHLHENGTESTLPTRPDKHVIISILIPLIQVSSIYQVPDTNPH